MSDLYFSWFELLLAKLCYYILQVLCNLLVSSGWYFLISAIFFAIFPSLLLIFATLSEISKMSRILSDLGGSPRNLLNFLIKPGTFFPSTLVAKEKTPSETARPIWVSISILYQEKIQNLLRKGMKIDLVFMVVVQKTDCSNRLILTLCSTQLIIVAHVKSVKF